MVSGCCMLFSPGHPLWMGNHAATGDKYRGRQDPSLGGAHIRWGGTSMMAQCGEHLPHGLLTAGQKPQAQQRGMMQKDKDTSSMSGPLVSQQALQVPLDLWWPHWTTAGVRGHAQSQELYSQQTGSLGAQLTHHSRSNEKRMVGAGEKGFLPGKPIFSYIKQFI